MVLTSSKGDTSSPPWMEPLARSDTSSESATEPLLDSTRPEVGAGRTLSAKSRARSKLPLPERLTIVVLLLGLLLTALLSWTSSSVYNKNEDRLLGLRVREAGSLVAAAAPGIQSPLASAADLASATDGDPRKFQGFIAAYVRPEGSFISASLWNVQAPTPRLVAVVGEQPSLARSPHGARSLFERGDKSTALSVLASLNVKQPMFGFAVVNVGTPRQFVVYAESALPANRRLGIDASSAFSELNYALYLGKHERPTDLIATTVQRLPITARHASMIVPFGDTTFTLVMTPRTALSVGLLGRLPWLILVFGLLLTVGAALMAERLARRRKHAERLATDLECVAADLAEVASENEALYREQRGIAETLQHALLPQVLPTISGTEIETRYVPGGGDVEIGGDWYDVIQLDEERLLLVIGDVSGRGLGAATVMASLRYSIRAFASESDSPSDIFAKLCEFADAGLDGHFATLLCAQVDLKNRTMTFANAGHLHPLLIAGEESNYIVTATGVPIGVGRHSSHESITVAMPASGTLLAFTDGLVEHRGENLDIGLERLRVVTREHRHHLDGLLTHIVQNLRPNGSDDDIALLALRW